MYLLHLQNLSNHSNIESTDLFRCQSRAARTQDIRRLLPQVCDVIGLRGEQVADTVIPPRSTEEMRMREVAAGDALTDWYIAIEASHTSVCVFNRSHCFDVLLQL